MTEGSGTFTISVEKNYGITANVEPLISILQF